VFAQQTLAKGNLVSWASCHWWWV